ncbi:unnamed protein product [Menidia menidia]|uniref:(Atlantic silverside) hypothetical protein n=1 Tax=Menidia menidia TaxID=238744 RepID=A0A8S4BSD2_9TELE|nr:unnamed protein product [Menidia menidia]
MCHEDEGNQALKDPCTEMNCTYGSTCVQSSDGLSAKCMCPLGCEGKVNKTVCGSDGKDYRNKCELHQHACKTQKNIREQFQGPCAKLFRVDTISSKPIMVTPPESCPPDDEPLCASDGQTYPSECAMMATATQKGIKLRKIHAGQCRWLEECKEECMFNAVCVMEQLSARCSCDPIDCDGAYKPVCGRDGRTYSNDCLRRKAECVSRSLISVKHPGPCGECRGRMVPLGGGGGRCVTQSVCLSMSMWLSPLAVWLQVDCGVTQRATSSSGL